MSREPITGWYRASVNPLRKGVYMAEWSEGRSRKAHYAYWDGKQWGFLLPTANEALNRYFATPSERHPAGSFKWRGLYQRAYVKNILAKLARGEIVKRFAGYNGDAPDVRLQTQMALDENSVDRP